MKGKGFGAWLREAIRYFATKGYVSAGELSDWVLKLRQAAEREVPSDAEAERSMRQALGTRYDRAVRESAVRKSHPGVTRFTVSLVHPALRHELDRRILASVDLIRLNRDRAIEQTLQRFSGWVSSIPPGGSKVVPKAEVAEHIGKPVAKVRYEGRRVAIDQGHKLVANIGAVIAQQSGAIAMVWHSHWRQSGYDYRPDHKERDGKVYAIRGNWALEQGLMTTGEGYSDAMTQPAEEVFCRCFATWINDLSDLPDSMLTAKGRKYLEAPHAGGQ